MSRPQRTTVDNNSIKSNTHIITNDEEHSIAEIVAKISSHKESEHTLTRRIHEDEVSRQYHRAEITRLETIVTMKRLLRQTDTSRPRGGGGADAQGNMLTILDESEWGSGGTPTTTTTTTTLPSATTFSGRQNTLSQNRFNGSIESGTIQTHANNRLGKKAVSGSGNPKSVLIGHGWELDENYDKTLSRERDRNYYTQATAMVTTTTTTAPVATAVTDPAIGNKGPHQVASSSSTIPEVNSGLGLDGDGNINNIHSDSITAQSRNDQMAMTDPGSDDGGDGADGDNDNPHLYKPLSYFKDYLVNLGQIKQDYPDLYTTVMDYKTQHSSNSHRQYCLLCNKTVGSDYEAHAQYHHQFFSIADGPEFSCATCYFGFSSKVQLDRHFEKGKQCLYYLGSWDTMGQTITVDDSFDSSAFIEQDSADFARSDSQNIVALDGYNDDDDNGMKEQNEVGDEEMITKGTRTIIASLPKERAKNKMGGGGDENEDRVPCYQ